MATLDFPQTEIVEQTTEINLTEGAIQRVRSLIQEKDLGGYALRVFVSGGGCSGMQYGMGLEPEPRETDIRYQFDDVEVVVDPMSMTYLTGATIDYVDDLMAGGFKIDNPMAVSSCGCGNSFRTEESSHAHSGTEGCC
ncbi:MAG: iron-sulfur cluster insertion protein ErpA [Anaerolineales bacterium]